MSACACMEKVDQRLAEAGANTQLCRSFYLGDLVSSTVTIATKAVEKKRGHSPWSVKPTFCPFCGVKLDGDASSANDDVDTDTESDEMPDLLTDVRQALAREGICAGVPAAFECKGDGPVTFDVVVTLQSDFHNDALLRAALDVLGLDVTNIEHEIYSTFNRTKGGQDEQGGKTWVVRVVDKFRSNSRPSARQGVRPAEGETA